MNDELDLALDSEFNNAGELLGFDALEGGDVIGALDRLSPIKRFQVLKKLTKGTKVSRGSRGEIEKFFKQMPTNVKTELLKGGLRLADYTIYSTKAADAKTIKMFEPQDDKEVGLRNISNAKLPKNQVFLVSGIYMLAGEAAGGSVDEIKSTNFDSIYSIPAIANGEFSLKSNRKLIVPENTPNRKFCTDNNTFVNMGYWKLDNPRLIKDEELIEFVVELGTVTGIPAETQLWVGLDGTGTTP